MEGGILAVSGLAICPSGAHWDIGNVCPVPDPELSTGKGVASGHPTSIPELPPGLVGKVVGNRWLSSALVQHGGGGTSTEPGGSWGFSRGEPCRGI